MTVSLATKGVIALGGGSTPPGGQIEIDPLSWQLIAIPIRYGFWDINTHKHIHDGVTIAKVKNYLMDQIEDIMQGPAQDFIEIANTFFGGETSFRSYIPGFTNPLSKHNFPLVFVDGSFVEFTAFWIGSIHDSPIVIDWGVI